MKKRNIILTLSIVVILFLLPCFVNASGKDSVNVKIGEIDIVFDDDSGYPYIDGNDRTMVPLRITMEKARCTVDYNPETQTAIVDKDNTRVEIPINTNKIIVNGKTKINDTEAVIKNDRTYLPIRAVLESVGYLVAWDNETSTVLANRPYPQHLDIPHFKSVNGSSTLAECELENGFVYYCAHWGNDIKQKYIKTLSLYGYKDIHEELDDNDLNTPTVLENTLTDQKLYLYIKPDTNGSNYAFVLFNSNRPNFDVNYDYDTQKIICENHDNENITVSNDTSEELIVSSYQGIPSFLSVCNGNLEYETSNIKVYSSKDFKTYKKLLDEQFTLKKMETIKIPNTQATTKWISAYYYKFKGKNIMTFELDDDGLDESFVFLYFDSEFSYPQYSEIIAYLIDSRDENIADVVETYKKDTNNYKYGYKPSIYSNRIYERKAKVNSVKDFERFLNQKYAYLFSPMGDFELDITIWDNSSSTAGMSFIIHVDFGYVSSDNDVITPYNLGEKYGYTNKQKEETLEMLKDMMKDIYKDTQDCLPEAIVSGCVYVSGYHYPHIKVEYYSDTALSWTNASGEFEWQPTLDTFKIY